MNGTIGAAQPSPSHSARSGLEGTSAARAASICASASTAIKSGRISRGAGQAEPSKSRVVEIVSATSAPLGQAPWAR